MPLVILPLKKISFAKKLTIWPHLHSLVSIPGGSGSAPVTPLPCKTKLIELAMNNVKHF